MIPCSILTSDVPHFDLGPLNAVTWRFVEDQYTSSTMKLVSSAAEQAILEDLLDQTKPPVPEDCRHLHYLQFTPFRYPARHATRFRVAGDRKGVFYGSATVRTCATEVAFYKVLFFLESPETLPPSRPFEMTAFSTLLATQACFDLSRADESLRLPCEDPVDYAPCHGLVEDLRQTKAEVIRFNSVRHKGGINYAVLTCAAFAEPRPRKFESWWFRFAEGGLFAVQRFGPASLEFPYHAFADDPRIAKRLDQP